MVGGRPTTHQRWSRERVLDAVRDFAEREGRSPRVADWEPGAATPARRADCEARFRAANGRWPRVSTTKHYFQSWADMLRQAGFAPAPSQFSSLTAKQYLVLIAADRPGDPKSLRQLGLHIGAHRNAFGPALGGWDYGTLRALSIGLSRKGLIVRPVEAGAPWLTTEQGRQAIADFERELLAHDRDEHDRMMQARADLNPDEYPILVYESGRVCPTDDMLVALTLIELQFDGAIQFVGYSDDGDPMWRADGSGDSTRPSRRSSGESRGTAPGETA